MLIHSSWYVQGEQLRGTKTWNVIEALERYICAYAGPMYILVSDGGPQYKETNKALTEYCAHVGITHRPSSALSPESNGFAEAGVAALKGQIRKSIKDGKNWQAALATHNGTGSPSEIFFQRDCRIPGLASLPRQHSTFKKAQENREKLRNSQVSRESSFRAPEIFEVGEVAVMRSEKSKLWSVPVEILATMSHGSMIRSYLCKNLDTNQTISCNKRLLRKKVLLTQQEQDNVIKSRRLITYRTPPARKLHPRPHGSMPTKRSGELG